MVNKKEVILKLLQRTEENGCTAQEAAVALAKARKLLAELGMSMEDLSLDETEVVRECVMTDTKSVSEIQAKIAYVLSEHFGVDILKVSVTNLSKIHVIGEKVKVDVYKEAFNFSYKAFKQMWAKYRTSLICSVQLKNRYREAYLNGYCEGIKNELFRSENETALVVVKSEATKEYMNSMKITGSVKLDLDRVGEITHYSKGYQDGEFAMQNKNKAVTNSY